MSAWKDLFLDALRGKTYDFTQGSIRRAIVLLSIPMILEMVMESLFAVVDVFFVGRLGETAISTVGLTESVITLVYSLAIGLSAAATAMVARRIGEKNEVAAAKAAMQAVILAIGVSILLGIAGVYWAEPILRLMGGSDELIASGIDYTRIMFASNIVIMMLFLLNGIFRGAGNAAIAMRALWISNGLNIILDPLFIFGIGPFPELGVTGAAVATAIGRGVGVLFQLYILFFSGQSVIRLQKVPFRFNTTILRRLVTIGSGSTFQFLIASASWIFMTYLISNNFGEQVLSGYVISIRVIIFTILPAWGIANAAATLVGQNLGANKPDRAEQSVWKAAYYNMLFLVSISVIFFLAAPQIISIFTDTPGVLEAGIESLRIICAGYLFFAYGMVISQAFNGAGDTYTPTLINFICFWMVETPLAFFLVSRGLGPASIYWSIAIAETLLAVICVIVFRRGKWKLVKV